MLSVKFQGPIIVDEKNLSALLAMAGVSAVVEPYLNGAAKPGRKPRAVAEPAPAPEPQASVETPAPVKPAGKKRGRKSNAEKEAEAAAAAAAGAGEVKEVVKEAVKAVAENATGPLGAALVDRFSKLIDTNFSAAKELLAGYGVERFSEVKPEHHDDFDAKLTELGV